MRTRFIDLVTIEVYGGKGGDGIVSFRRETFVPKGGPNGGDGGAGGSVVLVVNEKLTTLADFRNGAIFKAEKGRSGGSSNKTGRRGQNTYLKVPPGTTVFDSDTGEQLSDLTEPGQELRVAPGGMSGRGNASFATSRQRAPRKFTKGEPGVYRKIRLELSLIADAGLIGVPNAGKSTILSTVSAARPKVAGYPFTTLNPALGMIKMAKGFSFVLADLPGLIEGASEGVGLGLRFLRHVERNRILVYIVGAGLELSPAEQYRTVRDEVFAYKPDLEELDEIVVLSKVDLIDEEEKAAILKTLPEDTMVISAVTGLGMDEFLRRIAGSIRLLRDADK
ncbi:MAG: GTPase ObgE [Candidatus Aegiribacteria sp.]|nr:GTPase ObgE [Candidatus Aegiribacteria sp.]